MSLRMDTYIFYVVYSALNNLLRINDSIILIKLPTLVKRQ